MTNKMSGEKEKMNELRRRVPIVNDLFDLHGKVGEGAFSSVFLASLKSSGESGKKFAVKHLVPTCHPTRIEREMRCLKEIGGKDHIAGLDLCLRNAGSVVFVMPFMRHDKFADYVHDMGVSETKNYMRALLTALRRVHQFNIIHRDIKPNNFLYDRRNQRYLLVDFGLAEVYKVKKETLLGDTNSLAGKRKRPDENNKPSKPQLPKCQCFGTPKVCTACMELSSQVAPRAGTPGYRAPEVLLKYPSQTPAIDIWASGVIMICILSRTENFFRAPNDLTALSEIVTIFGSEKIQQLAKRLGKKLTMSNEEPGISLTDLCLRLQKRTRQCGNKTEPVVTFPTEAYDLLQRLLEVDHHKRITAAEALNHPFLNS